MPRCHAVARLFCLPTSRLFCCWLLLVGLSLTSLNAAAHAAPLATFSLTEYLDHDWQNELIFLDLNKPIPAAEQAKLTLTTDAGDPLPIQWVGDNQLATRVDLSKHGSLTLNLDVGRPAAGTNPVVVKQTADEISLDNGVTGVRVATTVGDGSQGPLRAFRLRSGRWTAGSSLNLGEAKLASYTAELTASGPVFAEALCRYTLEDGRSWQIRFRVIGGEPVVVVREQGDLDAGNWQLHLDGEFTPTHIHRRYGLGPNVPPAYGRRHVAEPLTSGGKPMSVPVRLVPWLAWWEGTHASAMALVQLPAGKTIATLEGDRYGVAPADAKPNAPPTPWNDWVASAKSPQQADDAIILAAGYAGSWTNPGQDGQQRGAPLSVSKTGEVALTLGFNGVGRHWILGAGSAAASLVGTKEQSETHRLMIKHACTSLEETRRMKLDWGVKDEARLHPRLFIPRDAIATVGRSIPADKRLPYNSMLEYLYRPSEAVQQRAEERLETLLRRSVGRFTGDEGILPSATAYTHEGCHVINDAMVWADLILSRDDLPEVDRQRLRAKFAFLAYKVASPDFYDLARNYRANPNMTTMRRNTLALLACMAPEHPDSQPWRNTAFGGIKELLDKWIGPKGEWIESPHYQCINVDLLCLLLAAERTGLSDLVYDERFLETWVYLAKTCTPPDPRVGGLRHFDPVGNTYRFETTCAFSMMARLWQKRKPSAANDLQWMWQQSGRPTWGLIGGASLVNDFAPFVVADFEATQAPKWGSELFPKHGAMLRSGFPSDRETQLHLLQGPFDEHYDDDRGAFTLWGKGQPLSCDWGYEGRMAGWKHNKLALDAVGSIPEFVSQGTADYLRSTQGPWHRQIAFMKDNDPLGANYFVLLDTLSEGNTTWNFWLNSQQPIRRHADHVQMVGDGDVDLEIFLTSPWLKQLPPLSDAEAARQLAAVEPPSKLPAGVQLLKTTANTAKVVHGNLPNAGWTIGPFTQQGLQLADVSAEQPPILWALYPRLKEEAAPKFQELVPQKVLQVTGPWGTDTIFLSREPMEYKAGNLSFRGTAGALQVRKSGTTLVLLAPGAIATGGQELTSEKPATKAVK